MSHLLRKPQANELSQGVKLVHEVKNRIRISVMSSLKSLISHRDPAMKNR